MLAFVQLASTLFNVCFVKLLGKRLLFLGSLTMGGLSCLALSINAFITIPASASSFDQNYVNADRVMDNTFAMVNFVVMDFFASVASGIPWMLISEIFPIRVRAAASGLSATVAYILHFGVTKTYINVEQGLSVGGALMLYSVLTLIGYLFVVFQYFYNICYFSQLPASLAFTC